MQSVELLKRYLKENYPSRSMLFLPHFHAKEVVQKLDLPIKNAPDLKITPPPKKPEAPPKKIIEPKKPIVLEKIEPRVAVTETHKMATILNKVSPDLFLHKELPRDDKAKQVKTRFLLPKIPIFYTKQLSEHRPFLENVAKALDALMGSCRLVDIESIEQKNQWSHILSTSPFSFIIAPDIAIFGSFHLITHFIEIPAAGEKRLGNIPLFLLPDLSLYTKDYNLKRSLWLELKKVCTRLSSSTNP